MAAPQLARLRATLQRGEVTAEALVEAALGRIRASPNSFVEVFEVSALEQAKASDIQRKTGAWVGPLAGIPVAVKDNLDVRGAPTLAGRPRPAAPSTAAPATQDAVVVERLKAAGAIIIGKTQLTELACTGVGTNPHYPPLCSPVAASAPPGPDGRPWRPRATGGSSSGSAVAVGLGQVPVALGTDTGGSCRIPGAFCGVVGYKPSFGVVPGEGCWPLAAESLDTIGPLARCVDDIAAIFRVTAGSALADVLAPVEPPPLSSLRLLVPTPIAWDCLDAPVESAFRTSLAALKAAGAEIAEVATPPLGEEAHEALKVIFFAEAASANIALLTDDKMSASLWKLTRGRLTTGQKFTGVQYLQAKKKQQEVILNMKALTRGYSAMLLPTCPIVPPALEEVADEEACARALWEVSRFTRLANLMGSPAASLPCHEAAPPGEEQLPVGLMVVGEVGMDEQCLSAAKAVESVLRNAHLGTAALPTPTQAQGAELIEPASKRARVDE